MDHNSTTIDIFGTNSSIVQQQQQILETIKNCIVNCHFNNDYINHPELLVNSSEVIVINVSDEALAELDGIANAELVDKTIIIVGDKNNNQLLSKAISARVSEFVDQGNYQQDLLTIAKRSLLHKTQNTEQLKKRRLSVVMNAKGGSGASFIASNIAYILSQLSITNTALIDLDLQFGSIGLNFDITPKYTIEKVLAEIKELDYLALEAHMENYQNALKLLLPSSEEIILNDEIDPISIKSLLYLMKRNYNQIIIDIPRLIDPLTINTLEQADHIAVVVQQSLAHYRDGRRLINILNKDLDIPLDKIVVIINRYDSKNSLNKAEMINILNHNNIFTITNDFKKVTTASDLGVPLSHSAPRSKTTNDLRSIAYHLGDIVINNQETGYLKLVKGIFG